MVSSEEEESDSSETEKEDDEGIVFVARATDEVLQGKTTPGRHQRSMPGQLPLGGLSFFCLWSKAALAWAKPKSTEHEWENHCPLEAWQSLLVSCIPGPAHGVILGVVLAWGKELDSIIFVDPFQLRVF